MFGRKTAIKKLVMLKDGLSNFLNDVIIEITIDESNKCIVFSEAKKKDVKTATLKFEKIVSVEIGEKGSTLSDNSTTGAIVGGLIGGTTGAIVGSTLGKKSPNIPTLKINYKSGEEIKEVNLYQCNHYSDNSIQLIKMLIDKNIEHDVETHIEL